MLVVHITSSVAWLGAVAGFLVLAIQGVAGRAPEIVRSAYIAMNEIGLYAIVPLSLAALGTGLVQAFGTSWGLWRHYWVVVKFGMTAVATFLLLLHQFTSVARAAAIASTTPPGQWADVGPLGPRLIFDAAAALALLVGIVAISIFKPWGPTAIGSRSARLTGIVRGPSFTARVILIVAGVLITTVVVTHLLGGGRHHGH